MDTLNVIEVGSWIAGAETPEASGAAFEVTDPWTGATALAIRPGGRAAVQAAVARARKAFAEKLSSTVAQRSAWLEAAADAVEARLDTLVDMAITQIGKPRRAATFEVRRSAAFIRAVARQLHAFAGEVLPLDAAPAGAGLVGFTRRVPYGVIGAVTPFNAPANLLVQKLAPALAMGNAIVVKPCLEGSAVAVEIADAFAEAGLPQGLLAVVTGDREEGIALAEHPDVALVTLTGGTAAGEALSRAAGAKPFLGELGGNSPNIVCADADIEDAVRRIVPSAFEASGQQCISTQRIIVEDAVFDHFLSLFLEGAKALKVGDPRDPATDLGPVVSRRAAERIEAMLQDARSHGARIVGGEREGCLIRPAVVIEPPRKARVVAEEIFGPVAVVLRARDVEDALAIANECEFGLQGACFTSSLETAFRVSDRLNCGSVWINEASRFRLDDYPFGGMGRSGFGREGVRYAMEEYSQWKFTGMRFPGRG